jgi:hypothetical protein
MQMCSRSRHLLVHNRHGWWAAYCGSALLTAFAMVNSFLANPLPIEQDHAGSMWSHGSADAMQDLLLFRPDSTLALVGEQTPADASQP